AWAVAHPGINAKRILSNLFISANVYPLPRQHEARLTLAKTNLAIFGTDDLYDANDISAEDMQCIADAFGVTDDGAILAEISDGQLREQVGDLMGIFEDVIADVCRLQGRDVSEHLR